jgi:hypothetical protein
MICNAHPGREATHDRVPPEPIRRASPVDSGRIRLPVAIDAKARDDFTLFVITTPSLTDQDGSFDPMRTGHLPEAVES